MKSKYRSFVQRWLIAIAWAYFTLLFGWASLYILTGDRIGYLGLLNSLAVYFFIPIPITALLATFFRSRELWIGTASGTVLFLIFWGSNFLPRLNTPTDGNPHPPMRVMTYNVLGLNLEITPLLEVIRFENADVVFIQEMNTSLASRLRAEFTEMYPYQIHDPSDDVLGIGIISRYPLAFVKELLPLDWVGVPQVLELDFDGEKVMLVNFHAYPPHLGFLSSVNDNFRRREAQAKALVDFARQTSVPLIIAGDLNASPLSDAYREIIHGGLTDAWKQAGSGFGHTFPGSNILGSSRPRIAGYAVPKWLTRIDYIFHSVHWETVSAHLAKFDGVSDHRGVVAELILKKDLHVRK